MTWFKWGQTTFPISTAQYRALLGDASAQVMKLVSRDLDRAKLPLSQAAE